MSSTVVLYFAGVGLALSNCLALYTYRLVRKRADHWHKSYINQVELNKKLLTEQNDLMSDLSSVKQSFRNADASFKMAVEYIKSQGIEPPVMVYHPDGTGYPESIVIHEEP